jgi:hypothetical protein
MITSKKEKIEGTFIIGISATQTVACDIYAEYQQSRG